MSEQELTKILPKLLRENPDLRYQVVGILAESFVTKGEQAALLEEIRKLGANLTRLIDTQETRFEQVDKRFEELIAQMDKRFEQQDRRFVEMLKKLDQQNTRLEATIGSMGRRWGSDLERTVLEIFRETLREKGVDITKVEKFTFKDVDGKYSGKKGFKIDVDVMLHNGNITLVEVKSRAELEHVEALHEKSPLVEKIQGRKVDRLMIVAVNIDRDALERAQELGIVTVYGNVLD